MEEIIDAGFKSLNEMIGSIDQLRRDCGKEKLNVEAESFDHEKLKKIQGLAEHTIDYILTDSSLDKIARDVNLRVFHYENCITSIFQELGQNICDTLGATINFTEFWSLYYQVVKSTLR